MSLPQTELNLSAAPGFLDGGIKDQRVKVGETIKYDLPICGEPLPEVSWLVEGKPLKAGGRVKMSTDRGKTQLKVFPFLSPSRLRWKTRNATTPANSPSSSRTPLAPSTQRLP